MRRAKQLAVILAILGMGVFLMALFGSSSPLKVGDRAPDFSLSDQNGQLVKLADFRGKKPVVLAFYPKASTPG